MLEHASPPLFPFVSMVLLLAALGVTAHVLLNTASPRAASGWIALTWFAPVLGTVLYVCFGFNRVQRHARRLQRPPGPRAPVARTSGPYAGLKLAVATVSHAPLLNGNAIELLDSAEVVFPQMVSAIDAAERSVALAMYIFDHDAAGIGIAEALARAHARGVEVRVLVDALGSRLSQRGILDLLEVRGVPVALFLPATPWSVCSSTSGTTERSSWWTAVWASPAA